jgi:nucleoside-diphosphate-sugar epimerase
MKKIIIIGSDSYIAKGLEKYLNNCNVQQYSFCNWIDNLDKIKEADCIINFSISPDFSTSTVDIDNVIDVQIAKHIKNSNVHYIFISSRKVYGTSDNITTHNENDNLIGHDYYSINKIKTEKKLQEILGTKLTILRVSNIIGEPVNRKGYKTFIGWISEEFIKNGFLVVNQNEESLKDFITKEFLHKNIAYFCKNRNSGIYNVSAGFGMSIKDILKGYVGNKIQFIASNEEIKDQFILDNNKLLNTTGISITRADIDKYLYKYHKNLMRLRFNFVLTKYKNKLFSIANKICCKLIGKYSQCIDQNIKNN